MNVVVIVNLQQQSRMYGAMIVLPTSTKSVKLTNMAAAVGHSVKLFVGF